MGLKSKGYERKPWLTAKYVAKQLDLSIGTECISKAFINKRTKPFPDQRNQWYYFLYTYTRMSLSDIGKFLGGKDHATVLHGINKYIDTELIKRKDGSFLYSGETQELHLQLTELFDEKARKRQLYIKSKGESIKSDLEIDDIYVRQRDIISRLLVCNLELREKIRKLEKQETFAEV